MGNKPFFTTFYNALKIMMSDIVIMGQSCMVGGGGPYAKKIKTTKIKHQNLINNPGSI